MLEPHIKFAYAYMQAEALPIKQISKWNTTGTFTYPKFLLKQHWLAYVTNTEFVFCDKGTIT